MKIFEVVRSTWDFAWDNARTGFYVTKNGQEVPNTFNKAASTFDRSNAQELTKKQMVQLRSAEYSAAAAEKEHDAQINKPLSEIEKRWIELDKKLLRCIQTKTEMPQEDLDKYSRYGQIVRKSLLNHTHPAMSYREKI